MPGGSAATGATTPGSVRERYRAGSVIPRARAMAATTRRTGLSPLTTAPRLPLMSVASALASSGAAAARRSRAAPASLEARTAASSAIWGNSTGGGRLELASWRVRSSGSATPSPVRTAAAQNAPSGRDCASNSFPRARIGSTDGLTSKSASWASTPSDEPPSSATCRRAATLPGSWTRARRKACSAACGCPSARSRRPSASLHSAS